MQLKILYQDNHIIVVEKPAGILSQRDYRDEESLLDIVKNYLKITYNKPGNVYLGLVHRLDRQVSGAIIFARTSKAAARLHATFKERNIVKLYIAMVPQTVNRGAQGPAWNSLEQRLIRKGDHSYIITDANPNSHRVKLQYKIIFSQNDYNLLLVRLITGKKHQIRAQLSSQGMPIIGDKKYGSKKVLPASTIALHATYVRFNHPVKDEIIEINSLVPDYILHAINCDQNTVNEIIKLDIKDLQF